jgi:hypothetical protein
VLLAGLFLAGALISGFTVLREIDPFDEGLGLQAARRVAAGQVPYRDFLWAYGPLQPYLLAGLSKLFGVSLLDWRILRVLADGGVALTAYLLVRPHAPRPVAFTVWLAVACEMAQPRSANPFPFALLAVLVALWLIAGSRAPATRRRWVAAALLTAVAAGLRLDFGIYGLAGIALVLGLETGPAAALRYGVVAIGAILLLYLPFAVLDGPGALYHALIGTSLSTGSAWRLPFPLHYRPSPGAGMFQTLKHGLDFYVPLLLASGLAACIAWLVMTRRREASPLMAGTIVFGIGTLAYLVSRADEFHAQPLFVVVAIGLGLVAESDRRVLVLAAGLLGLMLAHGAANRISALVRPPAESAIHVAVADGVEAPRAEARSIERMVELVDAEVPPGSSIYVLPRRSDLVRINDPLIYVLTERSNPTLQDFGLLTGAAAQRQIVQMLRRVHPPVIVRWTDPISSQREPNARGRSSGVHTLDDWVAAHYRTQARLYHYDVLTARG